MTAPEGATEAPLLAHQRMSDQALSRFPWWTPPVPDWQPIKDLNSSLRIAAIVSDRLYHGLRFEGELMLLTPQNWRHVLRYGNPDLLLVESTWETATGHWDMAQSAPGQEAQELAELVRAAHEGNLPAAYWITADQVYHEHYRDFARNFEHVFCADPAETARLTEEGIKAGTLLPCVQPALYNPFRRHEDYDALELGVLFDGWGDLDRQPENYEELLKEIIHDHRLDIIESRYLIPRNRLQNQAAFKPYILGCTSRQGRITALKYATAYVSFEKSLSTPTTQRWRSLEATASYLPVVHLGEISNDDILDGLVLPQENENEILLELYRFKMDDLYRRRMAHRAWRITLLKHTFSHRLKKLCENLNILHDWKEYPKISLITPTYRQEFLSHCLDTYERQIYPNKEFILVFNGDAPTRPSDLGIESEQRPDITLSHVPRELFAGAALNMGNKLASGDYCFRVDDDDYYGNHYILDLMLAQRAVSSELFGKPPSPFVFEGESQVYIRRRRHFRPFTVTSGSMLSTGKVWIGGNSISGQKDFFERGGYSNSVLGAADSILNENSENSLIVTINDNFNLIAERRNDIFSHTWKINPDYLKKNSYYYDDKRDLLI